MTWNFESGVWIQNLQLWSLTGIFLASVTLDKEGAKAVSRLVLFYCILLQLLKTGLKLFYFSLLGFNGFKKQRGDLAVVHS